MYIKKNNFFLTRLRFYNELNSKKIKNIEINIQSSFIHNF